MIQIQRGERGQYESERERERERETYRWFPHISIIIICGTGRRRK